MGYRSDVGYKIKFDKDLDWHASIPVEARQVMTSKDLFNTFLAEAKLRDDTKLCFSDDDGVLEIDENNLSLKFYASSVKWYESYPDVQCHEALLNLANEWIEQHDNDERFTSSPIHWAFCRLGEESDDVDERHGNDGYDLVYTYRTIEFG
jgi:hypothetical protein